MSDHELDPVLSLRGVSVRYDSGDDWIGAGLNLDVPAGQTVVLLGPSGCGKSTLLLAMAGLIPTSVEADLRGSVVCAGVDTAQAEPGQLASHTGVVFQDPDAQIVTDTLLDEVCFGLENLLVPVDEIEDRALAALRSAGLGRSRADALRSPAALSGGERQRLAIACALALEPKLIILDEPTANLDPTASAGFYADLAVLRDRERTIILVEHELDDVLPFTDRVVALDRSCVVIADGAPAEVFGTRSQDLREHGIWLPTATEIALRLGHEGTVDRLPVTLQALADHLIAADALETAPLPASEPCADGSGGTAESDVVVSAREATVKLGPRTVLRDIDLDVDAGEFLAVAGTNGAGKSTLTRALAGLTPLSAGKVELDGARIDTLDARQIGDRIGYVFQNPEHQFVTRTVRDELAFGLRIRGQGDHETAVAVDSMLERFDLARYARVNPFLLSYGEKRRLSVATALITEPEVLILDEPTFGQDRTRAQEMTGLMGELNAAGTTLIVVTHDLQLVADSAHRVAVLADGHLLATGPTSQILDDGALLERAGLRAPPLHRFARLVGSPVWQRRSRFDQIPGAAG